MRTLNLNFLTWIIFKYLYDTNIVYFNLRLRVAGMYASLTKSNKKKKTPIKEERCQKT